MASSWEAWRGIRGIEDEPITEVEGSADISVAGIVRIVNEIPYGGTEIPLEVIIPTPMDIISQGI